MAVIAAPRGKSAQPAARTSISPRVARVGRVNTRKRPIAAKSGIRDSAQRCFPLSIIALYALLQACSSLCRTMATADRCCFETTGACIDSARWLVTLPMLSSLWHNESQLLDRTEKVPMAGANGCFLANFIR
jgi:hypothetical protein